ncbi:MAG TPA: hypothetical protein VHB27_16155 [Rhodopila sp.]|uniref:hypothetical protein n=1 Tax=Rhodopila sp. TaxID=2480087 RepID=UPI002C0E3AE5|nr:hypothetical protein [Rhodopila sp.]HVY16757.1 hypothetical protein [Rhodopila sp.]
MLENAILDVIVGILFTFYGVSLVASAIVEAIASTLQWRASTLLNGVTDLLNDPEFNGLARKLYQHALISPRENGSDDQSGDRSKLRKKPSYINPDHFADALVQTIDFIDTLPQTSKAAIDANPLLGEQIKTYLKGVVDKTGNDAAKIRQELATWFDNAMDRVSGYYKRRTQWYSFLIAMFVAVVLNVNTLTVAAQLWHQPLLAEHFPSPTDGDIMKAIGALNGSDLPIGWSLSRPCPCETISGSCIGAIIHTLLGWLFTAVAALFGASFWFDALGKIVNLRGAGPAPSPPQG